MPNKYENGIFIFRRDFRVIDNIGLNLANSLCKRIYPVFIFTPEQVTNANSFKSNNAVQFMIESLQDLSSKISLMGVGKLLCFYGDNVSIISQLITHLDIHVVCFNADYTPYAIKRDSAIMKLCDKMKIAVEYSHDYYLHVPGTILNSSGDTYQKFTPFYNTAIKKSIALPLTSFRAKDAKSNLSNNDSCCKKNMRFAATNKTLLNSISLEDAMKRFVEKNDHIMVHGGRDNAIKQILLASTYIKDYSQTHNLLHHPTSQLSAYIKFGCVSIREVYKLFKKNHDFVRQLLWRDFYANILFAFPHVLGSAMKPNYNKIKWERNAGWFKKWCAGETGFPVVDAGMRQLNQTGYMHNRARLIVMSFLVKTLLLDWRLGEKYFATKLTDYDPASNNGNIQWIMGGGSDSNPYFRIFNTWRQTEEYDPHCEYILTWVPELAKVPVKDILHWDTEYVKYTRVVDYPKPIVNYYDQKEKVLKLYKAAFY
jgi:deoxyribodipyrimidine photo-lyase